MSYLRFEKALMTNLEDSLPKELLRTNRSGAYSCSTIVDCNTRKYHGLLVVPVPEIDDENHVLLVLVTDMGSEFISETFEQITELGITLENLPAYRPELKGNVEKFFDVIQNLFKPYLKGKGVIEPDFQERGARDYRKDACLTLEQFEKIIIKCILYYNSQRIIENYPYTEAMIQTKIKPYASDIWEWGKSQDGANLIPVISKQLVLTLLPRTTGKFSRVGLTVNRMRYKHKDFTEK